MRTLNWVWLAIMAFWILVTINFVVVMCRSRFMTTPYQAMRDAQQEHRALFANTDENIHSWELEFDPTDYHQWWYRCARCKYKTEPGAALPAPFDKECPNWQTLRSTSDFGEKTQNYTSGRSTYPLR